MESQSRQLWPQWLFLNNETWHSAILAGVLNTVLSLSYLAVFMQQTVQISIPLFCVLAVSMARIALALLFQRKFRSKPRTQASAWDAALVLVSLLSGTTWSLSLYNILTFNSNPEITLITQATLFALISASTLSLGKSRFLFALHAFPLMIADSWYLLTHSNSTSVLILSLGAIFTYGIFVIHQQRIFYKTWKQHQQQRLDLQFILNSIPGGVGLVEDGKYTFVNTFARHLTGLSEGDFDGREVGFSNPTSTFSRQMQDFATSAEDQQMSEVKVGPLGSEKYHFLILKKLPSETKKRFLILTFDIEEKKKLEKQSQDQQAQMIASAKFAALGEMAAGICHEINNPLAVITGIAEVLSRRTSAGEINSERQLQDLEKIIKNGFRISKIIRGLRTFSRDASQDPKSPITAEQIVRDALSICEARLHNSGIELRLKLDSQIIISCRPSEISQVILNALMNSLDALDSLKNKTPKWIEVETRALQPSGRIRIFIRDNGAGIPIEIRERLMTPFFTTKDIGKGTGLGLSISRGIIQAHGGQMFFNFEAPCTELVLDLPTANDESSGFQAA